MINCIIEIIALLSLGCLLILSFKRLGYVNTYTILAYATVIFPMLAGLLENRIINLNRYVMFFIGFTILNITIILLVLSVSNFFRKTKIQIFVSISFLLVSGGLLLFFYISAAMSGVGILS